jgi:hypothetical protein
MERQIPYKEAARHSNKKQAVTKREIIPTILINLLYLKKVW